MNRRNFIKSASKISIIGLGGYMLFPSFEKTIKRLIREETLGFKMDEAAIDNFMKEASLEKYWDQFNFTKRNFIVINYVFGKLIPLPYEYKYLQYKNEIVGQFLLSTNFFKNKMDTSKKVVYTSFYNPYKMSCSNPFSNLYYPA